MEYDYSCWIQFSGVNCRSSSNAESLGDTSIGQGVMLEVMKYTHQRYIAHTEDYHPLMFRGVFSDPTKMGLQNMVPIQEGHLAIGFYPHLESS